VLVEKSRGGKWETGERFLIRIEITGSWMSAVAYGERWCERGVRGDGRLCEGDICSFFNMFIQVYICNRQFFDQASTAFLQIYLHRLGEW
jgi:hypothetical protein